MGHVRGESLVLNYNKWHYENVSLDMGRRLFADKQALWKRGRNMSHLLKRLEA